MLYDLYDPADINVMNEIPDSRAFTELCCVSSPGGGGRRNPDGFRERQKSIAEIRPQKLSAFC